MFSRGSTLVICLANVLQMLGKCLADPSRSIGHGIAVISECRFMRYSLALQGITFRALWTHAVSSKNRFRTALEPSNGPFSGIRGDGLGLLGNPGDSPCPAPLGVSTPALLGRRWPYSCTVYGSQRPPLCGGIFKAMLTTAISTYSMRSGVTRTMRAPEAQTRITSPALSAMHVPFDHLECNGDVSAPG